jgi:hypothetical protein
LRVVLGIERTMRELRTHEPKSPRRWTRRRAAPYTYTVASADELREYLRRDWGLLGQAKHDFWINRRRLMPAIEALRIADELRRQVHAIRPDWPPPADRDADLAAHVHVTEILGRAASAAKR